MHCACDSCVPGAVMARFYPDVPFAQNSLPHPPRSAHTPIIQGFSVRLFTDYKKPRKAHLTKWIDLNLYSCLQVIPMS